MAKKKYEEQDGVWRTIGGRRVFIKNGQNLSDAMRESGKFKKASDVKRGEYQEARTGLEDIRESGKLKTMWQTTETEGKPTPKKILKQTEKVNEIRSELDFRQSGRYDNEVDYSGNISDLKGKHVEDGINSYKERTTSQVNDEYNELSKKMQQDDYYYKPEDDRRLKKLRAEYDTLVAQGQEDVNLTAYNKKENIKTITQEEYDKLPKDYKGTLKELVDTAEFRGENKEELRKFYEKQGFNIEEDKTILENENGGTILRPVKINKSNDKFYTKKDGTKEYDPYKGTRFEKKYDSMEDVINDPNSALNKYISEKEAKERNLLRTKYKGTFEYLEETTNMSGTEILELLKKIDEDKK